MCTGSGLGDVLHVGADEDQVSRSTGRHRRQEMNAQQEQREAIPGGRDGWGGPERERVGSWERIHEGTLDQQYRDALESGDELAAQVAKQLAAYVRDRFERSRGRDGPDHGLSR